MLRQDLKKGNKNLRRKIPNCHFKNCEILFFNFNFFKVERTLRVKGDLHVGGVMIKLVDSLGKSILYIINFMNYDYL